MEKTPIRAKFTKRLVGINDQLCFAALGRHELGETIKRLAEATPKEFTTAAFPENPFAKRLYRKMRDMPAFVLQSEQIELQMGVIAGVEHALAYMDEIAEFRARVMPSLADSLDADNPEDRLFAKMSAWMSEPPKKGPYRTNGFLRLLRNHYAHANIDLSPAFASYVRNHAHELNKFWDNGVTNLNGIDFKTLAEGALTAGHAFAIMNLLRVTIEMIDRDYAGTLDQDSVISAAIEDNHERIAHHHRGPEPLTRKIRAGLKMEYGSKLGTDIVRKRVDAFLTSRRDQKT